MLQYSRNESFTLSEADADDKTYPTNIIVLIRSSESGRMWHSAGLGILYVLSDLQMSVVMLYNLRSSLSAKLFTPNDSMVVT